MARILVIDDTKNIRKMLQMALAHEGHEVEVAADGTDGLAVFGDGSTWDLVLLDQRMPGLQGHAVLRQIQQRASLMRVIMITSFVTVELAAEVITLGAVDFLRKPFSIDTLRASVQTALSNKPAPVDSPINSAYPYAINGFQFWQVSPDDEKTTPAFEVRRVFIMREGLDTAKRCIVGLTPYACEVARREMRGAATEEAWDTLCRSALAAYLWDKATLPPDVLPIFELNSNQLYDLNSLASATEY